jgi:hypothetical protein
MTISKKLLIIGALLLNMQPTTHADYGKVFEDMFKGVATIGFIAGAAAVTAMSNDSSSHTTSSKKFDPSDLIRPVGIGLGIWTVAGATVMLGEYAYEKITYYYHKTQINNFANQLLKQKDNTRTLSSLASWLKIMVGPFEYSSYKKLFGYQDPYHTLSLYDEMSYYKGSRNGILKIINDKKTTLEEKITLLLKFKASYSF